MPTPDWDNLADFLDQDDFAVPVTFTLLDGSSRSISGIFDQTYFDATTGEYVADSEHPRITCQASDTTGLTRGCTALVDGITYDVLTNPQLDGTGMAVISLAQQGL